MAFDVRLRLYTPQGVKGRVLRTLSLDVSMSESSTPQLRFTTSTRVAGSLEAPFVVGVEYSTGGAWVAPRNNLYIATEDEGDTADQSGAVSFTAQGYIPWLLTRAIIAWASNAKDGHRKWTGSGGAAVSAGYIIAAMVTEAKARGWAPSLTVNFNGATDSLGQTWSSAEKDVLSWALLTPYSQVLETLSSQGLCEWYTEGMGLRLVRPGTGYDLTDELKFGGRGYKQAPVKSSFADVFTHLTVVPEKARNWLYLTNTGADTQFGRLEASMTQSGIEDHATATKLAQPSLIKGRSIKREHSFDWVARDGMPVPFVDFNIGDQVQARSRNGWATQRVVGIVVTKSVEGEVTVRAVTGSKLLNQAAKQAKKTGAATIGTIIGGSGNGLPGSSGPAALDPAAPTGLHVESNTADWGPDGSALATVKVAWNEVVEATDGSEIDVNLYELWAREADQLSALVTATDELSATVTTWRSGVPVWLKVRARSVGGRYSEFTNEITVTPASPLSIVPKAPTGLAVTSNTASFQADGTAIATLRLRWDAVTKSIDEVDVEIETYELWMLTGEAWSPVASSPARDVLVQVASGGQHAFKVRARTTLGVWSDFSATVDEVEAANPDEIEEAPSTPNLTTSLGMVQASWDGTLEGGFRPAGFNHVVVEYSADAEMWTRLAVPLPNGGGSAPIRGVVGETMHVRFIPVDTLGREGTPSVSASIVVEGVTGPDLEANSVTANHIAAGSVELQHLSSGLGSQIDLGDNQVIIQITSQQEALAEQVGEAVGTVTQISTWFRVDEDGAHIGETGNPFQAHMLPGEFNITENGVVTTYWEAGRMVVPSAVVESLSLANHSIEPYEDGTVVRALG